MIEPIKQQIAVIADEPEQQLAKEIYKELLDCDSTTINGEYYDLSNITDMLDREELLNAAQESVTDDFLAIHKIYIKTIAGLI